MKVKMTNAQALERMMAISSLDEKGRLGYAIAKNRRKIQDEIAEYIKLHDEALQEYGIPSEKKAGQYTLTPDAIAKINAKLAEYAGIGCEVDILAVQPEELCSSSLTSKQMFDIDWMVVDTEG